ncbi:PREDICTED: uncharacterized protein LOC109342324 [Lupinus angustifolius]|uniref:uncharacterized protein LOC109342324 n=1 Tax=Lupinus angustifolius TaxID=3871 RepID=UPI00092F79B5|nr:PREDICTED: uncharacterized protein LOC109342324 [Lupinus angustifolius]
MSRTEIEGNEDLIQGTCRIKEISSSVLFDSSATHSFLYNDVVNQLALPIASIPYDLIVYTPTNEPVIVSTMCSQCPITLDERTFVVDLICLPLSQLHIILGMNWLSNNHVLLNCFNKTIIFRDPKDPIESCYEAKSTTANQMKELLKDGAQVFMLLESLENKGGEEIQDLTVVRDFSEVFSDDIPGLPSVREIKFVNFMQFSLSDKPL